MNVATGLQQLAGPDNFPAQWPGTAIEQRQSASQDE